jgi:hypothetical protein
MTTLQRSAVRFAKRQKSRRASLRPRNGQTDSAIPSKRISFVLARFRGLLGALLKMPKRINSRSAQYQGQHQAENVPWQVATTHGADAYLTGSDIANVALHNAYGKLGDGNE